MLTRVLHDPLASGASLIAVPFPFLSREHVKLYSRDHGDGLEQVRFEGTQLAEGVNYTWLSDGQIALVTPADGDTDYLLRRETPKPPLVEQQPGVFSSAKVNLVSRQFQYVAEELDDDAEEALAAAASIPKGDPGGSVEAVGPFTGVSAQSIPAGVDLIRTTGHTAAGDYGHALYRKDAAVTVPYVLDHPLTSIRDLTGTGFRLEPGQTLSAASLRIKPNSGQDETNRINDAWAELSSLTDYPLLLEWDAGEYLAHGLVPQSNILNRARTFRQQTWYDRQTRFSLPVGAVAGNMIEAASGTNNWGFQGFEMVGSADPGFRCIQWGAATGVAIEGNFIHEWGEQAIRSGVGATFSHVNFIRHNLIYGVLMKRIFAGYAGAVELNETDSYLMWNQWGCSATREGYDANGLNFGTGLYNGSLYVDTAAKTIQMYNGSVPRLVACWLTGGGVNWVIGNNNEISEGGCIDDSYQSRFIGNRYEFNKAWGLLSRGAGGIHSEWSFNGNSRAGNNLYPHVLVQALTDGQRPRRFNPGQFDNTTTAWGYTTTASVEFKDEVYDSYPLFSDPTSYNLGSGHDRTYPIRILSSDPRIRGNGAPPPAPAAFRGENGLRNAGLVGAVAGDLATVGVLPTGWRIAGGGALVKEVLGLFVEDGLPYVRLRLTGTPGVTSLTLFLGDWDSYLAPAAQGEVHTASAFIRFYDGTVPAASYALTVFETDGDGGAQLAGNGTDLTRWVRYRPLDRCRQTHTRTLTHADCRRAGLYLSMGLSAVTNYNFTLDIACPQIERSSSPGAPVLTPTDRVAYPRSTVRKTLADAESYTTAPRTEHLVLTPAATIATGTVIMPSLAHQDVFTLSATAEVTALTLTPAAGQTFAEAAPTTLAAGALHRWRFDASNGRLYKA